jgi:tight adherence protein B
LVRVVAATASAACVSLVLWRLSKSRLGRRARSFKRSSWLRDSGLDVTPAQFWFTSIGAGLLTYLVVFAVTSLPVVSMMPAIVVATLPKAYFARRRARRLDEVQRAWPDGLRDLLSTVRSGSSLPTAIDALARFGPMPLRDAFHGFPVYSRSLGVVPALEMTKSDLADPTSDRVIEVLILAYERGGAVVPEILSDLAEATTRDLWTLEEIRTDALEQKINSRVVFILPWFVLVAMTARSGAFRDFYSSPAGILVAVIGALMSLMGVLIASRLGRQPAEPRVFVGGRGPA